MQPLTTWQQINRAAAGWIAALLAFVAVIILASATSQARDGLQAGLLFLGLLAGGFVSVLIHELGHAIAAWLVGWRVWIISAVPAALRLGHAPRFTAKLSRDVGGYVLGSPSAAALDTRWRSIVFSLGGPLASVITGPFFIYWLATFPEGFWQRPDQAGLLGAALALGFYSSSSAIMTLWPMRMSDGRPNDMGAILATLASARTDKSARESALGWAWALFEHGVEPSAWPAWMQHEIAAAAAEDQPAPLAVALACARAIEADDMEAARVLLRKNSHDMVKVLRAYLAACIDDDPHGAEDELAAILTRIESSALLRFRALAMIRIQAAAGDIATAQRNFGQLAAAIVHAPTPEPFWELLLVRARRDDIAARPAPPRAPAAASGPWGARPA
jgi:hypothetical protein